MINGHLLTKQVESKPIEAAAPADATQAADPVSSIASGNLPDLVRYIQAKSRILNRFQIYQLRY